MSTVQWVNLVVIFVTPMVILFCVYMALRDLDE